VVGADVGRVRHVGTGSPQAVGEALDGPVRDDLVAAAGGDEHRPVEIGDGRADGVEDLGDLGLRRDAGGAGPIVADAAHGLEHLAERGAGGPCDEFGAEWSEERLGFESGPGRGDPGEGEGHDRGERGVAVGGEFCDECLDARGRGDGDGAAEVELGGVPGGDVGDVHGRVAAL
jgi:hypothetical protein